jgi:hypothetical protein
MVKSNYNELNKFTLVRWMDMALNQSLTKQNIKSCFRVIKICSFNLKAMDEMTWPWPSKVYVGKNYNEVHIKKMCIKWWS